MKQAYFELLFATMFWGFGFIAAKWAFQGMGPIWMTCFRFLISVIFLDLLFRFRILGSGPLQYKKSEFLQFWKPGLFLGGMLGFQTWGLQYTSATKSGFITVLYVLFVPFFERIFIGTRIKPVLWLWIAIALTGTAMICGAVTSRGFLPDFLSAFNLGDWLTLICAILGAGHIIAVNQCMRFTDSPVKFNLYQCLWIVIFAAPVAIATEGFSFLNTAWNGKTWAGILHLGILSSAVAFLFQIRAQRIIPPTAIGLLVLMESPWSMFFSVLLGFETLNDFQLYGCGLILFAAIAESLSGLYFPSKK